MDENGTPSPAGPDDADPRLAALPGPRWGDARWLLLLLALVAGLRLWQVTHTEMLSRDSIGYIRISWRLLHEDWREVLPSVNQHPGFPITMLPLASLFSGFWPDDPVRALQLACQLTGVLASLVLLVPVYYLGKEYFDRRVGFWAALLLQCLPATGRLMIDGLSEPVYLSFAVGALYATSRGLRTGAVAWYLAAGLLSGLAYLTRAEGMLLVGCAAAVLAAFQLVPRWRQSGIAWGRCTAALLLSALAVGLPYAVTIGSLTVKPFMHHVVPQAAPRWAPEKPGRAELRGDRSPLPWAVWYVGTEVDPANRSSWALKAVVAELTKASCYVLWLPALLGLVLFADRLWRVRGVWVSVVVGLVLLGALYRVAQVMGYLSERHAALVVLLGLYPAVAAVAVLVGQGTGWVLACRPWAGLVTATVLGGLAVSVLPRTLVPLHGDRVHFRQAGEWLARHAEPGDPLLDPYGWAAFYAGRTFREGQHDLPASAPGVTYVVLENGPSEHLHLHQLLDPVKDLVRNRQPERTFVTGHGAHRSEVRVYRVPRS